MKQISKFLIKGSFIFVLCCFYTVNLIAQTDPCTDPEVLNCSCPEQQSNPLCPIDNGVIALLAAGLGYGIIRIRKQRKKNVPA